MANRHLSRSIVLQTLFEWDFNVKPDTDIGPILDRNMAEFGPGLNDTEFVTMLLELVIKKKKIVDEIIEKAAPDWPIDKINIIDRNILRMGLCELLFGDHSQVPPKVAINESIELAKSFGGENSGRFVNGVLGAVYKEIGEPGKDEVTKKKFDPNADPSTFPIEKKGSAIVYADHNGKIEFALVHDVFGYWTLAKGGIDDAPTPEEGTKREIKEEIGLDVEIVEKLGENEYIASHPVQGKIRKQVSYYLAKAHYQELELVSSGGLDGAQWFPMEDIAGLTMYDDIVPLFAKAIEIIMSQQEVKE